MWIKLNAKPLLLRNLTNILAKLLNRKSAEFTVVSSRTITVY